MTCGAAARTAMVAMIVKAVKVMRQSLSNTCSGDLEDDEDEDGDDIDDHEYVGDYDVLECMKYHGRELPVVFYGGGVFVVP